MPVLKRVNKNFFKTWTPEMAYVLGFFAADGNIMQNKRGAWYLSFHSADRAILLGIQKVMGSTHALSKRSVRSGNVYRFQIGSKVLCEDLIHLGLVPGKTKRLNVASMPKGVERHFIRGYFDGDGNVWAGLINKKRKKATRVLQAAFTSGSHRFLQGLLSILRRNGVRGGYLYSIKRKKATRLMLGTLDALRLYEIMYNSPGRHTLWLSRKKRVFEKFIKARNAPVV